MTTNVDDRFWEELLSDLREEVLGEISPERADQLLAEGAPSEPFSEDRIGTVVRLVRRRAESAGAGSGDTGFSLLGLGKVAALLLGTLALLAMAVVVVVDHLGVGVSPQDALNDASAYATYLNETEPVESRNSALVLMKARSEFGLRVLLDRERNGDPLARRELVTVRALFQAPDARALGSAEPESGEMFDLVREAESPATPAAEVDLAVTRIAAKVRNLARFLLTVHPPEPLLRASKSVWERLTREALGV